MEPYRRWSVYMKQVSIWFLITIAVSVGTVLGIFKGIALVMDHFLKDDLFYKGFAFSVVISASGTAVLFGVIFILIRKIGKYPRRRLKGLK